jgi:hypothetical protein
MLPPDDADVCVIEDGLLVVIPVGIVAATVVKEITFP